MSANGLGAGAGRVSDARMLKAPRSTVKLK
jgi:hypothetical protein